MTTKVTEQNTECCMCGDLGFSDQLFLCKICQFRSQHRYCSNLYPKTESFGTCNWCLMNQKEESPNSSNSSSSYRNNGNFDEEGKKKKIIGFNNKKGLLLRGSGGSGSLQIQIQKPMIMKKPKSPETRSPSVLVSTRKRIVTNGALEERLRRTRSENMINSSNNTITGPAKQVFRNKVRRYKLLDEVSS